MKPERPKQSIPAEIRNDLLGAIRSAFYGDATEKQWHQDKNFLLKNVVFWPASWLNQRGVSLPPARYKAIVLDVIQGIKHHGKTDSIKYWPGYLMHCVKKRFAIHGDEYYDEAKSLRSSLSLAMKVTNGLVVADPVRVMAEAQRELERASRKTRQKAKPEAQMTLLQFACIAGAIAIQTA